MDSLVIDPLPVIRSVSFFGSHLGVSLRDGRLLLVPLSWYPRLAEATQEELMEWELFADDTAIEWPLLDEHIGIEGLLAGRRSQESQESLERWRKERAHLSSQVSHFQRVIPSYQDEYTGYYKRSDWLFGSPDSSESPLYPKEEKKPPETAPVP